MSGLFKRTIFTGAEAQLAWLWHGYLAAGNITLLTSQWKSGKTTLVSALLAKMGKGGSLAGLEVKPGRAVMVSEESDFNWAQRNKKHHFSDNVTWLCRPFTGKPTQEEWSELVDTMVEIRAKEGLDLLVIDPLANFLPGHSENTADNLMAILLMLQRLAKLGTSILILHHPRKGKVLAGQAARGSGVLGGYADILLEMGWYGRPTDPDRRRAIEAFSRHEETPKRLVIELTADGTDYLCHGDLHPDDFAPCWEIIRTILTSAECPPTRAEMLRLWPDDFKKPDDSTLYRWLERLLGEGKVVCEGKGRRNDPYRYRLDD